MVVFSVGKDTLKISEAYINAFPAFSCPLFASKNPIVPQTELLHTLKNEVKVIRSLPAQS